MSEAANQPPKKLGGATGAGWKPGESGNPAGPPTGHVKLAHWLRRYMEDGEAGLAKAPGKAAELVRAMVRDAISRPQFDKDGNEHDGPGCPTTRGQIWDRHDGSLVQQTKDVTDYSTQAPRRIFVVQTGDAMPQMPEAVQAIERARAAAEDEGVVGRPEAGEPPE